MVSIINSVFLLCSLFILSETYPQDTQKNKNEASENEFKLKVCHNVTSKSDIRFYRIYSKTNECYHVLLDNPCRKNMKFVLQSDNTIYGDCDCNPEQDRTLIYHEETDQCYFIFQQAYCPKKYWLTLNRSSQKPICELNPCESEQNKKKGNGRGKRYNNPSTEHVMFNNRCVELGMNSIECENLEVVRFVKNKILPRCADSRNPVTSYALGTVIAPCAAGNLRSLSGRCQPSWEW